MVKMNYHEFKELTTNYINDGTVDDGVISVINSMLNTADANERRRSGVMTGIKEILREMPDGANFSNPHAPVRAGFSSETLQVLSPIYQSIDAMAAIFDEGGDSLRAVLTPRKSNKRTHYTNGADFADTLKASINGVVKAALKDGSFDGKSVESLVSTLGAN